MTTWTVHLPGQPLSVNHVYKIGRVPVKRKGVHTPGEDGSPRYIHRPIKTDEARLWTEGAIPQIRVAKPSGWAPTGFVRVVIILRLHRWIDADNILKLLFDALKKATGVDDKWFLPCFLKPEIGVPLQDARVTMIISDVVPAVSPQALDTNRP